MMNITQYNAELMKQEYTSSLSINYYNLGILCFLRENKFIVKNTPTIDLVRYVYRFIVDNEFFKYSTIEKIKYIHFYTPNDLYDDVEEQIKHWIQVGNGVLLIENGNIFTNEQLVLTEKDITILDQVVSMILSKNIKPNFAYCQKYDDELQNLQVNDFNQYLRKCNSSRMRNRAFENIKYCVCCEEYDKDLLFALHIDRNREIGNPDNTIVMCKIDAEAYFNGDYAFDKSGKIKIFKHNAIVNRKMHLSRDIIKNRKEFLEE